MPVVEADIPSIAKASAAIYRKWQPYIDKYHGGVPAAMVAVRMKVESGGIMDMEPGGGSLEEIGLLSVTKQTETRFSVPDGTRMTVAGNVFLGCLRYNVDTALFMRRYPTKYRSLADAYVFGQLIAGIGVGAAGYLISRAPAGLTYEQFTKWVAAQASAGNLPASGPWGSQSLSKIVYRVRAFWIMNEAGKLMEKSYGVSNRAGTPVVPPFPPGLLVFQLPKEARFMTFATAGGGDYGLVIVAAIVGYYLYRKM